MQVTWADAVALDGDSAVTDVDRRVRPPSGGQLVSVRAAEQRHVTI